MQRQDPRVVTTPAQEAEIIEAVKRKEPYRVIAARLGVSRACVGRVWQRTLDRALAEPIASCGPPAIDPVSGAEIDVTDDVLLGVAMRELGVLFRRSTELVEKLAIANVLPKLALARHRIKEPNPTRDGKGPILYASKEASPDCEAWGKPHEQTAQVRFQ